MSEDTVEIDTSTYTVTIEEDATTVEVTEERIDVVSVGTVGPAGPRGADGGIEDVAWTQVDDVPIFDFVNGAPVDFGTDGFCLIRYTRIGRLVEARVYFMIAADADNPSGGAWGIPLNTGALGGDPAVQLLPAPYMPPAPLAVPGGFGYLSIPGQAVRYAPTGLVDLLGTANPDSALILFLIDTSDAPTGLESLLGNGNPEDFDGVAVTYQGSLTYEAVEAA